MKAKRKNPARRANLIEMMEGRRLLSATLSNGLLTVTGTGDADLISVFTGRDGQVVVVESRLTASTGDDTTGSGSDSPNSGEAGTARLQRWKAGTGLIGSGSGQTVTRFALADVTGISISGGDGADVIGVRAFKLSASQDDAATVASFDNANSDDTHVRTAIPATISGGAGEDRIRGNGGADSISGGAGADVIDAAGGNDSVSGGDGDDRIIGGRGVDLLKGDAGNDTIRSADGEVDTVDGGSNNAPTTDAPGDVVFADVAGAASAATDDDADDEHNDIAPVSVSDVVANVEKTNDTDRPFPHHPGRGDRPIELPVRERGNEIGFGGGIGRPIDGEVRGRHHRGDVLPDDGADNTPDDSSVSS
jgi:Ca2+-binding RTX toxin-like protein